MIRFTTTGKEGRLLIGLGLSDENVTRLKARKPIWVAGETVGLPGADILILWGRTELEMTKNLADVIGPSTEIRMTLLPWELPPDHPLYSPKP